MKKVLGYSILAIIALGWVIFAAFSIGIKQMLLCAAFVLVLIGLIYLAVELIDSD